MWMRSFSALLLASATLSLTACDSGSNNAALPVASAPLAAIAAPAGTEWTTTVSETADGGFVMGNPTAPLKLVEYGSLTCPHCAHFAKTAHDGLIDMVKAGKVSYEYRSFIIHPQDLALSVLARCNGAGPYFPIVDQIYAHFEDMAKRTSEITPGEQKAWQGMAPAQVATAIADKLGALSLVQQMGVSSQKAKACLADPVLTNKVQHSMDVAAQKYNINETPTFIFNDQKLTIPAGTETWDFVRTALKNAGA